MIAVQRNRRLGKAGFTLVELLVVIAIIGVLVALLLPAVQAAREAARRSSCVNNLKNLSLATHNHHDILNRFPPGCARDQAPFGTHATGAGWGSSWKVYLLPYIEQTALHSKWVFDGTNSGYQNANNMPLVNRMTLKIYRCPSSPLPEFYTASNNAGSIQMLTSYTGIAGSNLPGTTFYTGTHGDGSGTGPLYANSTASMASLTDGTSNTFLIGEQSDHLRDATNKPIVGSYTAITSQGPHGWTMGAGQVNVGAAYTDRHFNCTTVAYQINQRGLPNSGGTGHNTGNNVPLSAAHPGGCVMALADGSARFVSQTTPLLVLQQMAAGNDGAVAVLD
jgi:prepilin-type N-terminal cleavage/methylation domain-containing protein